MKRTNRSSGATAYLAILASSGTAAYASTQGNKLLMILAIGVATWIYLYKIRR